MHTKVTAQSKYFSYCCFVSLVWLTGSMVGLAIAFHFFSTSDFAIQYSSFSDLSLSGIVITEVLPLMLTYCFIRLEWSKALYMFIFIKALLCGFCVFSIAFSFGQGVWLASGMLFSQICCCNLMFFLCLHALENQYLFRKISVLTFIGFAVICALERFVTAFLK